MYRIAHTARETAHGEFVNSERWICREKRPKSAHNSRMTAKQHIYSMYTHIYSIIYIPMCTNDKWTHKKKPARNHLANNIHIYMYKIHN